jgi:hypothetical protein
MASRGFPRFDVRVVCGGRRHRVWITRRGRLAFTGHGRDLIVHDDLLHAAGMLPPACPCGAIVRFVRRGYTDNRGPALPRKVAAWERACEQYKWAREPSKFIVKEAAARMPSSCWGVYKRVAVLEVPCSVGDDEIAMISERAHGVRRVVRTWEKLNVGGPRSAYRRARDEAEALALYLNVRDDE